MIKLMDIFNATSLYILEVCDKGYGQKGHLLGYFIRTLNAAVEKNRSCIKKLTEEKGPLKDLNPLTLYCGYSKELPVLLCSFVHPKHIFELIDKKINTSCMQQASYWGDTLHLQCL